MQTNAATPLELKLTIENTGSLYKKALAITDFSMNGDGEGFPLCNIYKEKVLPDENDLCSLCHMHSASVTWNGKWATLEQLKVTNNIPF